MLVSQLVSALIRLMTEKTKFFNSFYYEELIHSSLFLENNHEIDKKNETFLSSLTKIIKM